MHDDRRLEIIARTYFTYLLTEPNARDDLRKADTPDVVVELINRRVATGKPLTVEELPAVRSMLQQLVRGTTRQVAHEIEIGMSIGVVRGPGDILGLGEHDDEGQR